MTIISLKFFFLYIRIFKSLSYIKVVINVLKHTADWKLTQNKSYIKQLCRLFVMQQFDFKLIHYSAFNATKKTHKLGCYVSQGTIFDA